LLSIPCFCFVITSSLDKVHMRRGDISRRNCDLLLATKWCQPSRSAACKKGNMICAYYIHFWHNPIVNLCGISYKWNDMKPMNSWKRCKTIARPTERVSSIDRADSKGDLSSIARIVTSRLSRGGLPMQFSSWRSWQSPPTLWIHNWTARSAEASWANCAWNLWIMSWASGFVLWRNRIITLWS
jgi:hypothetical protein